MDETCVACLDQISSTACFFCRLSLRPAHTANRDHTYSLTHSHHSHRAPNPTHTLTHLQSCRLSPVRTWNTGNSGDNSTGPEDLTGPLATGASLTALPTCIGPCAHPRFSPCSRGYSFPSCVCRQEGVPDLRLQLDPNGECSSRGKRPASGGTRQSPACLPACSSTRPPAPARRSNSARNEASNFGKCVPPTTNQRDQ